MNWYGKYEDDKTQEEEIAKRIKNFFKKEEYNGGNLEAIKA